MNACCSIGSACWNSAGVLQELTVAVLVPQKSASEENALIRLRVLWNVLSRMKELYEVGNNARSRSCATKSNEPTRSVRRKQFRPIHDLWKALCVGHRESLARCVDARVLELRDFVVYVVHQR